MKNNTQNLASLLIFLIIIFLLLDSNNIINVPDYIYYTFFIFGFIISGTFLHCYIGKSWINDFKSILYFIIALLLTAFPLSFLLVSIFNISIIYYNYNQGEIINEKCLVEHVSSGKYRSLSYNFRGESYNTKLFDYEDYENCNYDCYIELTLEKKPFGMFYILNIEKY
jgi:hypothetical protein